MGKIRDKVYELPHGRYSKVAMDIKERGGLERQDWGNSLESAGNGFACNGELQKDFKQERHVVRSGF